MKQMDLLFNPADGFSRSSIKGNFERGATKATVLEGEEEEGQFSGSLTNRLARPGPLDAGQTLAQNYPHTMDKQTDNFTMDKQTNNCFCR